ncbi:MAG: hypothetical protein NTU54_05820 [Candidatus Omnitrophica bacterium]|nr:hypothetical protein [Candidatus Omnitrophota bacterium]
MKRILGIALLIVLCFADLIRAEDHVTLTVTCSIPAVPGLNAPLVEEQKTSNEKQQTQAAKDNKKTQETVVQESDGPHAIVKTFDAS